MTANGGVQKRIATAGFLGFFIIGAVQALYGPSIPQLLNVYQLNQAQVGLALSAQFLGTVLGILLSGVAERAGTRSSQRLVASCVCLVVGMLLFPFAPTWPVALIGAAIGGLGYGGLDININLVFATSFGSRGASMLNLVNAAFGVGAIAGPVLVAASPQGNYRWAFVSLAVLSVFLFPLVASSRDTSTREAVGPATHSGRSLLLLMGLFILAYFVYVGMETGVSGWETRFTQSLRLLPETTAAALPALFWAGLTLGRLAATLVSRYARPQVIVIGSLTLGVVCLALAHITGIAVVAFTVAGLFLGPVFPTGLAWLGEHAPVAGGTLAIVVAAAAFGGVLFPPVIGGLFDAFGPHVVPTVLTMLGVLCLALFLTLTRFRVVPGTRG
ncbi:MAG TPA: MFS transporter [Deinococcales bacterium]|nr:MFS transporter [Deinococcales bacterium]